MAKKKAQLDLKTSQKTTGESEKSNIMDLRKCCCRTQYDEVSSRINKD